MADQEIQARTFEVARRVLRLARGLDEDRIGRVPLGQVLRSGTSIGANVEEAQGAQSKPDFIAKMAIELKEARETLFWLRLIQLESLVPPTGSAT
jgi:four helix bundle protein